MFKKCYNFHLSKNTKSQNNFWKNDRKGNAIRGVTSVKRVRDVGVAGQGLFWRLSSLKRLTRSYKSNGRERRMFMYRLDTVKVMLNANESMSHYRFEHCYGQ